MRSHIDLYNSLPSLTIAHAQFANRDDIFAKLAPLLAKHGNKFAVCIIHRHCNLEAGEKMVASGNITQPETDGPAYADRWLVTGEPYEFRRESVPEPPEELFTSFRELVGETSVLGLCYAGDFTEVMSEKTVGRANILAPGQPSISSRPTSWMPGWPVPIIGFCGGIHGGGGGGGSGGGGGGGSGGGGGGGGGGGSGGGGGRW